MEGVYEGAVFRGKLENAWNSSNGKLAFLEECFLFFSISRDEREDLRNR